MHSAGSASRLRSVCVGTSSSNTVSSSSFSRTSSSSSSVGRPHLLISCHQYNSLEHNPLTPKPDHPPISPKIRAVNGCLLMQDGSEDGRAFPNEPSASSLPLEQLEEPDTYTRLDSLPAPNSACRTFLPPSQALKPANVSVVIKLKAAVHSTYVKMYVNIHINMRLTSKIDFNELEKSRTQKRKGQELLPLIGTLVGID